MTHVGGPNQQNLTNPIPRSEIADLAAEEADEETGNVAAIAALASDLTV